MEVSSATMLRAVRSEPQLARELAALGRHHEPEPEHAHGVASIVLGMATSPISFAGAPWSSEELYALTYAAYAHDLGKLDVPASILRLPRALSPTEYEAVKPHVHGSRERLHAFRAPELAVYLVGSHHVHQNYPRRTALAKPSHTERRSAHLNARWRRLQALFIVADVFDAAHRNRGYHASRTPHEAYAQVHQYFGSSRAVSALHATLQRSNWTI